MFLLFAIFFLFYSFDSNAFFCMYYDEAECIANQGKNGCRLTSFNTSNCRNSCECISALPGYYLGTTGSINKCPSGHYCYGELNPKTPCPKGTYNDKTQQGGSSACISCKDTYYCPTEGSASQLQCGVGQIGYKVNSTDSGNTGCKEDAYACPSECLTCTSSTFCNSCKNDSYYLQSGSCKLCSEKYKITNGSCVKCDAFKCLLLACLEPYKPNIDNTACIRPVKSCTDVNGVSDSCIELYSLGSKCIIKNTSECHKKFGLE